MRAMVALRSRGAGGQQRFHLVGIDVRFGKLPVGGGHRGPRFTGGELDHGAGEIVGCQADIRIGAGLQVLLDKAEVANAVAHRVGGLDAGQQVDAILKLRFFGGVDEQFAVDRWARCARIRRDRFRRRKRRAACR